MPYTRKDAIREVGDSTNWLVGLETSIKKYEQRVRGEVDSYRWDEPCGLCFVRNNRWLAGCHDCLGKPICQNLEQGDKKILWALKKLRKELDPMDCKDKCVNYKPVEVERPTDHPNRIFAEDLRVGMVIRRHNVRGLPKLVVILDEPEELTVKSLQFTVGFRPHKCDLWLANSGLQPNKHGSWNHTAWCEEVT